VRRFERELVCVECLRTPVVPQAIAYRFPGRRRLRRRRRRHLDVALRRDDQLAVWLLQGEEVDLVAEEVELGNEGRRRRIHGRVGEHPRGERIGEASPVRPRHVGPREQLVVYVGVRRERVAETPRRVRGDG
jgi:hypothetical protein